MIGISGWTDTTHTGVVVSDLQVAMRRYGAAFGISFAPVYDFPAWTRTLQRTPVPLTWSTEGPPHLELITATPHTIWDRPGQHHVGRWVDDLDVEIEILVRQGFRVEYSAGGFGSEVEGFAYVGDDEGLRLELTSTRFRPAFDRWLSGEPLRLT